MNTLEAVARALFAYDDLADRWEHAEDWLRASYISQARAAINALADNVTEKTLYPMVESDMCCATLENLKSCIRSAADD